MARTHEERLKAYNDASSKSIIDVAHSLGMGLEREGANYSWSEHDSFMITPKSNTFFWNSRRFGGGPVQLVETIKECNRSEAVNFINGVEAGLFSEDDIPKKKPFNYFMKEDPEMAEARKYLSEERKISPETIDFFIKQGVIAQSVYTNPNDGPKEIVVVFKHKDLAGNVKGVGLQGIYEDWEIHSKRGRLKKTFGDGFTGMSVRIGNPPATAEELSKERPLKIIAFEAPIDLMSYYELHKETLQDVVLLSMNGLRKGTISKYIADVVGFGSTEEEKITYLDKLDSRLKSSDLFEIVLAVDNDEAKPVKGTDPVEYVVAGQDFVDDFGIENIQVSAHMPALIGDQKKSDWNEFMKLEKAAFQKWETLSRESQNEILIIAKENPPNLNLMLEKHGLRDAALKFSNFSSMLTNELVTRYNSDLVEGVRTFNTERQKWLDQNSFGNVMYIPETLWEVAEKHGRMENYPKVAISMEDIATKSDQLEKSEVSSPEKMIDSAGNSQISENDNSRLAQAKRKLARLEGEADAKIEEMYAHQRLTNGQPMNDKGKSGAAWFKAHEKIENQVSDRLSQIAEQKERVERLEYQEELKVRGMNQQGGLIMSVENIPRIRQEIERSKNGDSMFTKATIRKYERKLPELEKQLEQSAAAEKSMSDQARSLIDSGAVTQWPKNPTIYFVKELRKVALELTPEGIFQPAEKYPAKTEEEKARIEELLSTNVIQEIELNTSLENNVSTSSEATDTTIYEISEVVEEELEKLVSEIDEFVDQEGKQEIINHLDADVTSKLVKLTQKRLSLQSEIDNLQQGESSQLQKGLLTLNESSLISTLKTEIESYYNRFPEKQTEKEVHIREKLMLEIDEVYELKQLTDQPDLLIQNMTGTDLETFKTLIVDQKRILEMNTDSYFVSYADATLKEELVNEKGKEIEHFISNIEKKMEEGASVAIMKKENLLDSEQRVVETGEEVKENTTELKEQKEDASSDQSLEDSLFVDGSPHNPKDGYENEKNHDRYFQVEFNETSPSLGINRYQGQIVTQELINEIQSFESVVFEKQGYLKFFFDEVVNGEVIDRHRMDVGDGLGVNKPMYDFLKEAAVSQKRATVIKPGLTVPGSDLVVAGGGNQKSTSSDQVETKTEDRYFRVSSNEIYPPVFQENYGGQIVTHDFVSNLYKWSGQAVYPNPSSNFIFDEVVDGQIVGQVEMEVGGQNFEEKQPTFERLKEAAVSNEEAVEIGKNQIVTEAPVVEKSVDQQQSTKQPDEKREPAAIDQSESAKIMQASSSDFVSDFKQALDDTFDLMEEKPEGTNEYLTKTELDQILDEHLSKIEQLVASFTTSDSLLENPTDEQRVGLVRGMLETVKAAITQFKEDLSNKLSTKKDNVIFSVKDTTDSLRISTKNSINARILKINDSIKKLTGKIDNKIVLEEKVVRSKPDSKAPEAEGKEQVDSAVELAEEALKEPIESKDADLVHLTRNYLQLTEETRNVSESIREEIVNNPLANVQELQEILIANKQLMETLENQISEKMPAQPIDESKEQSAAAVVSVAALVKERDELVQQRDSLAHRPDFLQSMSTDEGKGSLVTQFKELDSKVTALDQEIQSIESGTKEVATPEKQVPDIDPITMAAASDGNLSKEVSVSQAASIEKPTQSIQEISESTNVNELTANLKAGVKDLLTPDSFKKYLDSASKLHSYSSNNVQLIMNQDQEATQVASENKWNQMGYELNEGAKKLFIYAPDFQTKVDKEGKPILDNHGKEQKELAGFHLNPVYDVRQTTANKDVGFVQIDVNDKDQFAKVFQGLTEATKADVSISTEAESKFSKEGNSISIGGKLGFENTVKTLIEASARLNYSKNSQQGKPDPVMEKFEAHSVRYIVSNRLGLDTSDLSFDFVSEMKGKYSDDKLNRSLDTITKQASAMIKEIDKRFDQKQSLAGPRNKFEERVEKGKIENQRAAAEAQNRNYTPETKEQSSAIRM